MANTVKLFSFRKAIRPFNLSKLVLLLFLCNFDLFAAELPVVSDKNEPFSFIVLSDTHYTQSSGPMADKIQAVAVEARKITNPPVAFVCLTGDMVEGGRYQDVNGTNKFVRENSEQVQESLTAALNILKEAFHTPVFIATGNHDTHPKTSGTAYQDVMLPFLSEQIGAPVKTTYYALRFNDSYLIFLETQAVNYKAQQQFLKETLEIVKAKPGKHLFLFGHIPLWNVTQTPHHPLEAFNASVLPVLRGNPVDAYFCGHTHRVSVSVRDFEDSVITQVKGAIRGDICEGTPLTSGQMVLTPKDSSYYWGYFSPGGITYYLVRVTDDKVNLQLRVVNKGIIRECEWKQPGKVYDVKQ